MSNKNIKVVSIEGNIGSGKSTLLNKLKRVYKETPNIIFLNEPVSEWDSIQDENGTNMLEKYYSDPDKYSFSFQMMAFISRLANIKKAFELYDNCIIITERTLYTDKYVFAQMLVDTNKMEDILFQIYNKWFDTFVNDYPLHKVIYVDTFPEVCFERISKRSREGESNIPLNYLAECNRYHATLLNKFDDILSLPGNIDIYEQKHILDEWIRLIDEFIKK